MPVVAERPHLVKSKTWPKSRLPEWMQESSCSSAGTLPLDLRTINHYILSILRLDLYIELTVELAAGAGPTDVTHVLGSRGIRGEVPYLTKSEDRGQFWPIVPG
jgi:hypothetical protein